MSANDDKFDETLPTTIDPGVPTGARDRPAQFDPRGRLKDNRTAVPASAKPVVGEVISALPPVRPDAPVPPKTRAPSNFNPHGRIDDTSRTAKWAPRDKDSAGEESLGTEIPTRVEGRSKAPTKRGHDGGAASSPPRAANPLPLPLAAPYPTMPPAPSAVPPRDRSEPMRVISMKTPADLEKEEKAQRVLPAVKLRAISDVHKTPARGMGNLAPPRDPREARSRRLRDNVMWGSLAVILASIVTLVIWFIARR